MMFVSSTVFRRSCAYSRQNERDCPSLGGETHTSIPYLVRTANPLFSHRYAVVGACECGAKAHSQEGLLRGAKTPDTVNG